MMYIKNFVHDFDSSTITFEVEREGVTNHVETRDTGYGTTSTDINDFTEDWSDSEYNQFRRVFKRLSRNSAFVLSLKDYIVGVAIIDFVEEETE